MKEHRNTILQIAESVGGEMVVPEASTSLKPLWKKVYHEIPWRTELHVSGLVLNFQRRMTHWDQVAVTIKNTRKLIYYKSSTDIKTITRKVSNFVKKETKL